ncbi:MAG: (4Fe-4S)-binding protein, partial [Gemmatimonadetes bacterium]|nr:(4Fe-4S)-binding protein [Gemmatimonadota bacterium]
RSNDSMTRQVELMIELKEKGAQTFDYGNNSRTEAFDSGVSDAYDIPGFVPQYVRNLQREGVTIHDDRSRCSHAGVCTDNLSAVFKFGVEPWIDPNGAEADEIIRVVGLCPSGALTYSLAGTSEWVETPEDPSITVAKDGPFAVRGLPVVAGDGEAYDTRERQALCRCGGSRNKPFCDGSHWYMGFKHAMGDAAGLSSSEE